MVNPCLILGYLSLDKIAWIIFIVRQEIPRNIEPSPFLIIGNHLRHPHLVETFDIPKMSVRIDCYVHFANYTSQVSPPITHNQGVHDLDIFISGGIFGAARPSIIFNATPTLLNSAAHFVRRRLLPKGFHEVFMNFLGRHCFLTEVLDNRSDFKFLHFANVSHPPLLKVFYISNQA